MSEQQQPKEYICNDDDLGCLYDYMMAAMAGNDISELPRLWDQEIGVIKSRQHQAPAFKRCCDSCINVPCKVLNRVPCLAQEKQENACEENGCTDIENCDEICQHSRIFSPLQMQESKIEAARKAREDVLEAIQDHNDGRLEGMEILFATPSNERTESAQDVYLKEAYFELTLVKHLIESLRSHPQHSEQEERAG